MRTRSSQTAKSESTARMGSAKLNVPSKFRFVWLAKISRTDTRAMPLSITTSMAISSSDSMFGSGAVRSAGMRTPESAAANGKTNNRRMTAALSKQTPLLGKGGVAAPLNKRSQSFDGADGHERSECEPDRAKQGRIV